MFQFSFYFAFVCLYLVSCIESRSIRDTAEECRFTNTPGHALYGFNDKIIYHESLEDCKEKCLQDNLCLSFDYNHIYSSCFISTQSKVTQPLAFAPLEYITYYEKQCGPEETTVMTTLPTTTTKISTTTTTIPTTTIPTIPTTTTTIPMTTTITTSTTTIPTTTYGCEQYFHVSGGFGGDKFSDKNMTSYGRITGFKIRHGRYVNCISFTYGSHIGPCHGGEGGEHEAREVFDDDEYIIRLTGHIGDILDKIRIFTNKRSYGDYGTSKGGEYFDVNPVDGRLVYFYGKAGGLIDRLDFYFEKNCQDNTHPGDTY